MESVWQPPTFEDEIFDMQPDCDLIFLKYGNESDSEFDEDPAYQPKNLLELALKPLSQNMPKDRSNEIHLIDKIQKMALTQKIGELPSEESVLDSNNVEQETVAMMRNAGLEPSVEERLTSRVTRATDSSNEGILYNKGKKRMPIFMDAQYFKLKPKNSSESSSNTSSSQFETADTDSSCFSSSICSSSDGYEALESMRTNPKSKENTTSSSDSFKTAISDKRPQFPPKKTNLQQRKLYTPRELYAIKKKKELEKQIN